MKKIYEIGDVVFHKAIGNQMVIVCFKNKKVECRYFNDVTGFFVVEEFFEFEIMEGE